MTVQWAPEPCDTGQPDPGPVPPLGWYDLLRQGVTDSALLRIETINIQLEGVL